jgi:hypothetical protein
MLSAATGLRAGHAPLTIVSPDVDDPLQPRSERPPLPELIADQLRSLASKYATALGKAMVARVKEMEADDTSHFLIYGVLGVGTGEGRLIDVYQNKGRFLYKYAGSFLEEATKLCFRDRFPDAAPLEIPNPFGSRPKTFEIDCLVGGDALEIKWRDATTDGDHITKEHTRLKAIAKAGYLPVRIMFYYPNRTRAIRVQETLATLYAGLGGTYCFGDRAWHYVQERTGIPLKTILESLALENQNRA